MDVVIMEQSDINLKEEKCIPVFNITRELEHQVDSRIQIRRSRREDAKNACHMCMLQLLTHVISSEIRTELGLNNPLTLIAGSEKNGR